MCHPRDVLSLPVLPASFSWGALRLQADARYRADAEAAEMNRGLYITRAHESWISEEAERAAASRSQKQEVLRRTWKLSTKCAMRCSCIALILGSGPVCGAFTHETVYITVCKEPVPLIKCLISYA